MPRTRAPDLLEISDRLWAAEEKALLQRCRPLGARRLLLHLGWELQGEWLCDDEPRVCEELLWATNEALEELGYTATYTLVKGTRHVVFHAYLGQRTLLDHLQGGEK